MSTLLTILLVLHLLSWGVVLGGAVVSMREAVVARGMLHAALSALATGVLLVGIQEMLDYNVNHMIIGIKLVAAMAVCALIIWGTRNPEKTTTGMLGGVAGLVALNVVLGVLL